MSGSGAPALAVDGSGLRVAVVAASWHDVVMDGLLDGARRGLRDAARKDAFTVRVPGTFELPVAAARLAADPQIDAIVALGVVIRGGTPHFDYVCQAATTGLTEVSLRTGIPIGFGVLTCDNEQQALDRAGLPVRVSPLGSAGAGQAPTSRLWGLCRLGVVPLLGVDEASSSTRSDLEGRGAPRISNRSTPPLPGG